MRTTPTLLTIATCLAIAAILAPRADAQTYDGERPGSPLHCNPSPDSDVDVTVTGVTVLHVSDHGPCLLA